MPRFTAHRCITVPLWLDRYLRDRDPQIPYSGVATVAFGELVKQDFTPEERVRFAELKKRIRTQLKE